MSVYVGMCACIHTRSLLSYYLHSIILFNWLEQKCNIKYAAIPATSTSEHMHFCYRMWSWAAMLHMKQHFLSVIITTITWAKVICQLYCSLWTGPVTNHGQMEKEKRWKQGENENALNDPWYSGSSPSLIYPLYAFKINYQYQLHQLLLTA